MAFSNSVFISTNVHDTRHISTLVRSRLEPLSIAHLGQHLLPYADYPRYCTEYISMSCIFPLLNCVAFLTIHHAFDHRCKQLSIEPSDNLVQGVFRWARTSCEPSPGHEAFPSHSSHSRCFFGPIPRLPSLHTGSPGQKTSDANKPQRDHLLHTQYQPRGCPTPKHTYIASTWLRGQFSQLWSALEGSWLRHEPK